MYEEMMDDNQGGPEPEVTPTTTAGPTQTSATEPTTGPSPKRIGVIFVASLIELIAAGRACAILNGKFHNQCDGSYALAVSVGAISLFVTLVTLIYVHATTPSSKVLQVVGLFLMVLWLIGAGFNTFDHPFKETSNGYFSSWLAFGESAYFCYSHVPAFKNLLLKAKERSERASKGELVVLVLFISSLVELLEALIICNERAQSMHEHCDHQYAWAVAIGVITCFFTGLLLVPRISLFLSKLQVYIALLLAVLWIPGAGVLTFNAPFTATGNGFFATWVSFGCTVYWVYIEITTNHPELQNKVKDRAKKLARRNEAAPPPEV